MLEETPRAKKKQVGDVVHLTHLFPKISGVIS